MTNETLASLDVTVPDDLRCALVGSKEAEMAFAKLPPSHKKEYLKWIEGAKRPGTRNKRIAQTVERLTRS